MKILEKIGKSAKPLGAFLIGAGLIVTGNRAISASTDPNTKATVDSIAEGIASVIVLASVGTIAVIYARKRLFR